MKFEHCIISQVTRNDKTNEYTLTTDSSIYRQGISLILTSDEAHRFYQWCSDTLDSENLKGQFRTLEGVKLTVERATPRFFVAYATDRHGEEFTIEVHDGDVEEIYSALEGK